MSNLYSDRNKANVDEVIIFDELPRKLRVQFKFIMDEILKDTLFGYKDIHRMLCEKYGELSLGSIYPLGVKDEESLTEVFTKDDYNLELIFDLMELMIKYKVHELHEKGYSKDHNKRYIAKIQDLINLRFKESSMGYKMVNGQIIRQDSEVIFTEIIEPTINLTYNKFFENVNKDFVNAIKEYQSGKNKNCLVKALNSLESTLKIICDEKGWGYNDGDGCSKLIDVCFENGLIPSEMKSEFTSLNSLLKSGTLPIRNNYAGHGDGGEERVVKDYLARYALNITGSCILFLIEASSL
ncbi:STM4504/CBY_0614 family protein [uncultured Methanobrevibacter sp.]|uniref:STM4504/CBY_0614 family protein n=1 Tax=uncultured Methanobrevibacter sp. TaxID=253161 RepID=UPI00262B62F5|nr:hypothetical protein [uncultured Methanobrevibacter sp.]